MISTPSPKRVKSPAATSTVEPPKRLSSKVYNRLITAVDKYVPGKLRPMWLHPAGPKTIFFWAPLFKWGLVIAGISDLTRPADSISITGCAALGATNVIWSRYSLVIIPKNYSLFAVNAFVALTQGMQVARAYSYQLEQKKNNKEINSE